MDSTPELSGVSETKIWRIRANKTSPTRYELDSIANALGVDTEILLVS